MSNSRYGLFIEKTRNLEDQLSNYKSYIIQDHKQRQISNFENKTSAIIVRRKEQKEINSLNNQRENFLNIRRQKLSNLLKKENEQYHKELLINQDTPENQRHQMEEKLKNLKILKEKENQNFLDTQKEKIFFNDNDEVRKYDTEYNELKCCIEQENQMLDKLKIRHNNYLEEKAFDDMNKIDYLKKLEREKKEEDERIKKNQELNEYRDFQRNQELERLKKLNEINKYEKERLKKQWEIDEANELKEKIYKREVNKKVNEDIKYYNQIEKEKKEMKDKIEKEKDKEMINEVLLKEKKLDEIDRLEKLRKKDELMKNADFLKYKMKLKKEEEEWMDKLADEEAERQYQKEQEKWLKEQAARIQLMKDVYKDRAEAIMRKKKNY